METKRCAYCHKLQRASARLCRGCGHPFAPQPRVRSASSYLTRPSLPPASPHLVGHYSGLHPEDQPYQSNIMTAQRPIEPEPWSQPEPEQIILPTVNTPVQPVEPLPVAVRRKHKTRSRRISLPECAISLLLTIACLAFLLGSSILAYVFLGKHTSTMQTVEATPAVWTNPAVVSAHHTFVLSGRGFGSKSLMLFTYDEDQMFFTEQGYPLEVHTSSQGNFSLRMQVPLQWQAGTHLIHVTDEAEKMSISVKITVH
jgi:hypothetical protein